jgi:uncharacterized protein YgfB (UPF0149 family)
MIQTMYRTLDDWLVDQDADIRASEIQGLLAGLLAASRHVKPEEYAGRLAEYADLELSRFAEIAAPLETLFQTLRDSWDEMGLEFELLIPEDDELIEERADALGAWCEAFLAGLGLSGTFTQETQLTGDARQALEDLSEIARIEVDESDDALEKAFADVSEHVRLAALLVATELNGQGSAAEPPVMH